MGLMKGGAILLLVLLESIITATAATSTGTTGNDIESVEYYDYYDTKAVAPASYLDLSLCPPLHEYYRTVFTLNKCFPTTGMDYSTISKAVAIPIHKTINHTMSYFFGAKCVVNNAFSSYITAYSSVCSKEQALKATIVPTLPAPPGMYTKK